MEIGVSNTNSAPNAAGGATTTSSSSSPSSSASNDGILLEGTTVSSSKVQQEAPSVLSQIQLNDPNQPLEAILKKENIVHSIMKSVTFKPGLLLVVAVTISHFFGYLNLSYFWSILLVPLMLASLKLMLDRMVRQRVRKYQNVMRDMKAYDYESIEWLNGLVRTACRTYTPLVEKIILTKVNQKLIEKKVEINSISFGNRMPRLNRIKTSQPYANSIEIETDLELDSNLKVCLSYKKGVELHIKASNLCVSISQLRIFALLSTEEPFVPYFSITAIEEPIIDIKIKTQHIGIQLSEVPGLSNIIQNTIKEVVSNSLHYPNKIEVDLLSIVTDGAKSGVQMKEELEGNLTKTVRREAAKKAAPDSDIFSVVETASDKVSKAVLNFGGAFRHKLFQSQPDDVDEEEKRARHLERQRIKREKKESRQPSILPNPLDVPNILSESITGAIPNPFKKREKVERDSPPDKMTSEPHPETAGLEGESKPGSKSEGIKSGSKIEEVKPAASEPSDLSSLETADKSMAPPKVPERASAPQDKKLEHQDSKRGKFKDKLAKLFHSSEKADSR